MNIEYAPDWAFSWCYIFAILGVVALIYPILALLWVRGLGISLALLVAIAGLMLTATYFTLFWMCRSSLRDQRNLTV